MNNNLDISDFDDWILEYHKKNNLPIESISFSGGGYNCVYHLGCVKYIFEHSDLFKNTIYLGASAGAGIISLLLSYENDENRMDVLNIILDTICGFQEKNLKFYEHVDEYSQVLFAFANKPRFEQYIKNTERCHISLTNISYFIPRNEIRSTFTSYNQFVDTIKASACIPFILDGSVRTIDNIKYIDGGLSNNLPMLNEKTIRISCINYPLLHANVYPKKICEIKYSFYPPSKKYINDLFDLGYNDMSKFMEQRQKLSKS